MLVATADRFQLMPALRQMSIKEFGKLTNSGKHDFCYWDRTDSMGTRCYNYFISFFSISSPFLPRKIYLTSVSSKLSSLRNAMNACPCCSAQLLRHVRHNSIYWFCSRCRQEMPVIESLRTNLHQKLQTSKPINKIVYKKILLTTP